MRERETQNKEKQLLQRIRQGAVAPGAPAEQQSPPLQGPIPRPPLMNLPSDKDVKRSKLRLLIIGAAVIVIIGIVGFWYWYARIREKPEPTITPPASTTEPATTTPANGTTPEPLTPPTSLIPVNTTFPLKIASNDQTSLLIQQIMKNTLIEKDTFSRILIENTTENKYLSVSDILSSLEFSPPSGLYGQIEEGATFFVFPTDNYSVFGFTAKGAGETGNAEIMATMKSWESTLISQTRQFGASLGKTNMVPIANFQQEDYKNNVLRYLTLSPAPDCFGACYSAIESHLLFATCCKPIINLIDNSQ